MKSEHKKKSNEKKLKRISSINVILWRNFSLLTIAVIVVVSLVCYGILGNAFYARTKDSVNVIGKEVCAIINDGNLPYNIQERRINDYALTSGADIFVIDANGSPVVPYGFATSDSWDRVIEDVRSKVSEWQEGKTVVYSSAVDNVKTLNFVRCVTYGSRQCKVLVRYPLESLFASVTQTQFYLVLLALIAIAFAFFISYFVAEKLSRPIRDMSKTAKRLAGGDYSAQFTETQYVEIGNLSATLNYMKDEIKKSDEFQKELIANVSHDLKTPLTMIKAYASMVQEISGDDPEKRAKHLQVIIDESDRLTGLVNDVLNTSKISAGIEQINKKVFNLTEFLYGTINKFGYLSETQGYNLMVDIDAELYTFADEEKIGQVFYNLISNAINYTGEDKTVYISLKYSAEDNRIKFAVRDTGKGIPEDELAHIWDRYYRSSDSHTRPVKGTGLGLNIVKVILQSHAFDYGVTSDIGKGSTFYVDFPVE